MCKVEFRFDKEHVSRLQRALRLPEIRNIKHASPCSGLEALCVLLKWLAYPVRYCDMVPLFRQQVPELGKITHYVSNHIYENHSFRLQNWNQPFLSPQCLQLYCNAIHSKGAPLSNCFGFVDGTVRPICRPRKNQRIMFDGHKRMHGINFQSVCHPKRNHCKRFWTMG